jgi:hypothetical protein
LKSDHFVQKIVQQRRIFADDQFLNLSTMQFTCIYIIIMYESTKCLRTLHIMLKKTVHDMVLYQGVNTYKDRYWHPKQLSFSSCCTRIPEK